MILLLQRWRHLFPARRVCSLVDQAAHRCCSQMLFFTLSKRYFRIHINQCESSSAALLCGVPQGSILGPVNGIGEFSVAMQTTPSYTFLSASTPTASPASVNPYLTLPQMSKLIQSYFLHLRNVDQSAAFIKFKCKEPSSLSVMWTCAALWGFPGLTVWKRVDFLCRWSRQRLFTACFYSVMPLLCSSLNGHVSFSASCFSSQCPLLWQTSHFPAVSSVFPPQSSSCCSFSKGLHISTFLSFASQQHLCTRAWHQPTAEFTSLLILSNQTEELRLCLDL